MAAQTTPSEHTSEELLTDLQEALRRERRRVEDEQVALKSFLLRISDIETNDDVGMTAHRRQLLIQGDGGLRAVRDAYEETVMSTPHYRRDYDDTYRQSLAEEFGPELATVLIDGRTFDTSTKRAVIEQTRQSLSNREQFLDTLELEASSLRNLKDPLSSIEGEVASLDEVRLRDQGYGALEADWRRLGVLDTKCSEIAADRQETIDRQRGAFRVPNDVPDFPHYLYKRFERRYPVLARIADLSERIEGARARREWVMSRAP